MENYYIDCSAELEDRDNAGLKDLSESLDLDWLEDKLEMKLEELAEKSRQTLAKARLREIKKYRKAQAELRLELELELAS
tara:strand:- start:638 stop:877 length:240 start_codon:yes stop_codon:yes gene_type:complete